MRKPKPINQKSLSRICANYQAIRSRASVISNLNARSSDDMVHDAILLAAQEDLDGKSDAEIVEFVIYRMETIIYKNFKQQQQYIYNANDKPINKAPED